MKKILYALVLMAVMAGLGGCLLFNIDVPDSIPRKEWFVKNSTDRTLIVRLAVRLEVGPGSKTIVRSTLGNKYANLAPFEYLYMRNGTPDNRFSTFEILSEDGTLLRRWTLTEKDAAGKQFFNKSSWSPMKADRYSKEHKYWEFEILPEDIR